MKKTSKVSEYVYYNELRKNVHTRIADGIMKFYHEGEWYTMDKFNKMYPKYEYIPDNGKGENPNKKLLI